MRNYIAVIQVTPTSKLLLKVLNKDGFSVYEKQLDRVIESWLLTKDQFFFLEDLASNIITYVKLDGEAQVKYFKLPPKVVFKRPITASMEPLVQAHPSEDKQALRDLISSEYGPVKPPEENMMAVIYDKLYFITDGEVMYFNPNDRYAEEVVKGNKVYLN